MDSSNLQFNKKFFRDFWKLLTPYWKSEEKKWAWFLLGLLIFCVVAEVSAGIGFNFFDRYFYDALQAFDKHKILNALYLFVALRVFQAVAMTTSVFTQGRLSIYWQQWLTHHYLKKYLHHNTHYHLQFSQHKVDNPDQRMTEDLQQFAESTINLLVGPYMLLHYALYFISFGTILWQLSKNFSFHASGHSFHIPGYLLLVAVAYASIGTVVVRWIGRKLSFLDYTQQHLNANFRFSLIRMREASEQVSLFQGEAIEHKKFRLFFNDIVRNFLTIVSLKTRLTFFNRYYDFISYAISFAVSIPFYLSKQVGLGLVMQTSNAFQTVIQSISIFPSKFQELSDWRAVIYRLTEFQHSMELLPSTISEKIVIKKEEISSIVVSDLQLRLPHGKKLLGPLDLEIAYGEKILLQGPPGCGKSTLLRALAGLWKYGEGTIILPKNAKILFLPQKSYLPLGTFKELICYPDDSQDQHDVDEILKGCFLEKFIPLLHDEKSWSHQLSLGEQQLLSFARVFFYKPDILFLDEATSSLDEETEVQLYERLEAFFPHLTLISVGHRKTLDKLHNQIISIWGH